MDWIDDAIVLSARPHGEAAAVATLLTHGHGCHAGLVQGGRSARHRGTLQPGNRVVARWRARLADHLGTYTLEPVRSAAAGMLDDPLRLAALQAACALAEAALPEREPHGAVHDGLAALIDLLDPAAQQPDIAWAAAYVQWELGLLRELGFGLDLTCCAATGSNDGLAYVSPRTGRAVSLSAGEAWRDRLLPLPPFLTGHGTGAAREVLDGLGLTGHFLERHALAQRGLVLPAARSRFVDRYRKTAERSGILPP
jgi:DNA repair protein RecO (recombination protein O)